MSVVFLVEYEWDVDWSTAQFPTAQEAAPLADVPGLQWKLWIRDERTKRRGGFYLFADRASAETWREKIIDKLRERSPGVTARILDIDEANSRLTRGPLDVPYAPIGAPQAA